MRTAEREVSADRRIVTVLFADISGFTSLGERLDPEELASMLKATFGELVAEITGRGGWLEKHIGDALFAVFGAPVVHEDDPVRAVDAALAMQRRMASINERIEGRVGRRLELRVGVNTGLVVRDRHPGAPDLIVVGDTVNTGKRLEEAAAPGQVLVGAATAEASSSAFAFRQVAPLRVKGKREPVLAYECIGPSTTGSTRGADVPLVGRDAELSTLSASVDRVAGGSGGLVFVTGEAGVGKSRLVEEARRRASPDIRWLEGRTVAFGRRLSYAPFIEIVRSWAGLAEGEHDELAWSKLDGSVRGALGDEGAQLLPYLAALLGVRVPAELAHRVRYLSAESLARQIFRASWRLFAAFAAERPLVLVLEDWHWADESSARLLEHLLGLVDSVPLLVVCTSRPQPEGATAGARSRAGGRPERVTEIRLAPLVEAESADLVAKLIGADELPHAIVASLARAEGNPFFLEEFARMLVDAGAIVREDGRWRVAATTTATRLPPPDTVRGIVAARVDRLDEPEKEVLRVAAVIGRTFSRSLLVAVHRVAGLGELLSALERHDLIRREDRAATDEFVFRHALTQEAVYESILLARRRELHERVASALEQQLDAADDPRTGVVAYHYARAEQWAKAHEYLLRAGDHASQIAADAEAVAHYCDALEISARGDRLTRLDRAQLDRKLGEALFRRGDNERAFESIQRALAVLAQPLPTSRRAIRRQIVAQTARQAAHFMGIATRSRETAIADPNEVVRLYTVAGWIDYFRDQERLLLDVLLLTNESERHGLAVSTVTGYLGLGLVAEFARQPAVARRYFERALRVAERTGNPVAVGEACIGLGYHHHAAGRWRLALQYRARGAALFWDAGELRRWGSILFCSRIFGLEGVPDDAVDVSHALTRAGREGGDKQIEGWGAQALGRHRWHEGALGEATTVLTDAVRLLDAVPDHLMSACARGDLAECQLLRGEAEAALASAEDALAVIRRFGLRGIACSRPYVARAEALLALAEDEPSRAALAVAKRACSDVRRQSGFDREVRAAAYRLTGTYEWLCGDERSARRWWRRAIDEAERVGTRYELALTLAAAGARTGDRADATRAQAVFDAIGAPPPALAL